MQKKLRLFSILLITGIAAFGLVRLYFRMTDDFRLGNITHPMPFFAAWDIPTPSSAEMQKINGILAQHFTYIGKGAQSYAFQSEDQRYVLKFFKFKHLTPHWFVEIFPPFPPFSTYREKQAVRKEKKLNGVFEGYRLAYGVHKEASGLIYIQLNPVIAEPRLVTILDKAGFKRSIDLTKVPFILQEKAITTRTLVQDALEKGNLPLVKQRLRQIFDLYATEYQKGIYDKDHGVMHNTGFVDDRPIHLDVGKLMRNDKLSDAAVWEKDMEHIAWKFDDWIRDNYPKVYPELSTDIESKLTELFGRHFEFRSSTPPPKKHR